MTGLAERALLTELQLRCRGRCMGSSPPDTHPAKGPWEVTFAPLWFSATSGQMLILVSETLPVSGGLHCGMLCPDCLLPYLVTSAVYDGLGWTPQAGCITWLFSQPMALGEVLHPLKGAAP